MKKREPIILERRRISKDDHLVVMGVDPGLAKIGVAILQQPKGGAVELAHLELIETKKETDKTLRKVMRVADEDQRRYREVWNQLLTIIHHKVVVPPSVMGIESYTLYPGQLGGNSWKTGIMFGVISGLGYAQNMLVMPFRPGDLKKHFTGKKSASKGQVARSLFEKVVGLEQGIQKFAKGKQEHITDAAAHAYLAMHEVYQMRRIIGIDY
jgi:Holliday junction resolvasome RuvABC endonuclease subunit